MTRSRSVFGVLILVQVFFATTSIAGKIVLRELSSPALVLIRVAAAALVFYLIHRASTNERIQSRRDYARLAIYSVLGVSLNQLLFIYGLSLTTATAAQMLVAAGPAITLGVAIVSGKEIATPLKWVGIALAFAGALLLIGAMPAGGKLGNVIILASVITYSSYLVVARGILRTYHPLTVITWVFIFGATALLPIGLLPAIREFGATSLNARLGLLWIILFPTVAAYYLNMWALTKVKASVVSTFVYLQPIITALLAIPILHELPSVTMIPAALLIFAGVAVSIHEGRSRDPRPSPADQTMVEP